MQIHVNIPIFYYLNIVLEIFCYELMLIYSKSIKNKNLLIFNNKKKYNNSQMRIRSILKNLLISSLS